MLKNIDNVKSKSISKHFNKAFTIVELLIVIVIIGILAAITIVSYTGISKKAGESTVQAELANAKKQIALYHVDHGAYPTSLEDGTNCLKGTVAPSPDTKYCLKSSAGSTFSLTDATGSDYTLTLTKGTTIAYKVTKDTGPIATAVASATFVKTWGGTGNDYSNSLIQTSDGGYAVTGNTTSYGAASNDMFIAKYDASGNLSWNKTWGGTSDDYGQGLAQTSDGGYVVTGYTNSYGSGNGDIFLVKYDTSGGFSWNKLWGGTNTDYGTGITKTSDGGCALIGYTASYGAGSIDTVIAKYDVSGNLSWSKSWGGTSTDTGNNIIQTSDGGYVITGNTLSYGAGGYDVFLVKYDSSGALSWSKTWGGSSNDVGQSLIQTSDGGYAITGNTLSYGAGSNDMLLIKYDNTGNFSWNKLWGGASADYGNSLAQTSDSGYVIAGNTASYGAGGNDVLLVKYNNSGSLSWNKLWGGVNGEVGNGLAQSSDGSFAVAGLTANYGAGGNDMLLLKYDTSGSINNCSSPMCQSPTATITTPTATVNTPSATVTTPAATVSSPSATTTTPTATVTTVVAP